VDTNVSKQRTKKTKEQCNDGDSMFEPFVKFKFISYLNSHRTLQKKKQKQGDKNM